MAQPQQVLTLAENFLNNLNANHYLNPNYDRRILINHSIKIFMMSYPDFDPQTPDDTLYRSKLDLYLRVIQNLFDQTIADFDVVINAWKSCQTRRITVVFAIKWFAGRRKVKDLGVVVINNGNNQTTGPIKLDNDRDDQINKYAVLDLTMDEMKRFRQKNQSFTMGLIASQWNRDVVREPLNEFVIDINQIHPEGYQQWFDFGRGVRLLIEITFKVKSDPSDDAEVFHLQTIFRMIGKRRQKQLSDRNMSSWHKHKTRSNHVTFLRPPVQPESEQIFWRQSTGDPLESLRQHYDSGTERPKVADLVAQNVLYFDLQKCGDIGDDFEDRVCLCNEWCNLTAFFHFNPIFRFIIVQNRQLFIDFAGNVPEMYVFSCARHLCGQNPRPLTCNVIQLLRSANEYRQKYYNKYIMANQVFLNNYQNCRPSPSCMCGVAYNSLRYETQIITLCHQLARNPLSDICVKNLLDYYKVVSDLHFRVSLNDQFVDPSNRRQWTYELDEFSRKQVAIFFKNSYDRIFQYNLMLQTSDFVFGSDIEYQKYVPKTVDESYIKYFRNRALRWGPNNNLLNVRVDLRQFTMALISVYKFFARIEPLFPVPHEEESRRDVSNYCVVFDNDFRQMYNSLSQDEKESLFRVSNQTLDEIGAQDVREQIYAFYCLKLYSFGFWIQKHCITARDAYLRISIRVFRHSVRQVAECLTFVYNFLVFEEPLRSRFQNKVLFRLALQTLNNQFEEFYDIYWGKADHEMMNYNNMDQIVRSALNHYYKLYVWLTHNGNRKLKFTLIIDNFYTNLGLCLDRSREIFDEQVMPGIGWLSERYEYAIETLDVVMLYVVRAACFCLVCTVAALFRRIQRSQVENLCRQMQSFSMAKPGWVGLFRTKGRAFEVLNHLRTINVDYDDEIERISTTLSDTRKMVQCFYKHYYMRLSIEWLTEVTQLVESTANANLSQAIGQMYGDLMEVQLIVGLSFSAAFLDDYRFVFSKIRRSLYRSFAHITGSAPHLQRFKGCELPSREYLRDRNLVREAQPFSSNIWLNHLNQTNPNLIQKTEQDVALNLQWADFP